MCIKSADQTISFYVKKAMGLEPQGPQCGPLPHKKRSYFTPFIKSEKQSYFTPFIKSYLFFCSIFVMLAHQSVPEPIN